MTTVGQRTWEGYEYPTDMGCASGDRCPLGGDHALYGGISWLPALRDRQHQVKPWYPYRSGPIQVLPGVYYSKADARADEDARIASGRYLANVKGNEWNPCRWSFDPAEVVAQRRRVARRQAQRRLARRLLKTVRKRRGRKTMIRRGLETLAGLLVVWYVFVHNPQGTATLIKSFAVGVGDFFTSLAG